MLENWFVNNLTLAKVTRDSYGDISVSSQISVLGLIRDNLTIVLNDSKEETDTNAIAWLPSDVDASYAVQGGVIYYDTIAYRIIKIVRAKRGGSNNILFVKAYLQVDNSIGGIS